MTAVFVAGNMMPPVMETQEKKAERDRVESERAARVEKLWVCK